MLWCMLFVFALLLSACGATSAPTPAPTSTPPPTPTLAPVPEGPQFAIDAGHSTMRYLATGAGLLGVIQLPGTFGLTGRLVTLSPEGDGYRVHVELVIDGNSATAINGFFLSTLRSVLEIDTYPTATFTASSDRIISLSPGGGAAPFTVMGILELRGRRRPLALPLNMTIQDGVMRATGQVMLDLFDYDVNVPTAIMNSRIMFVADITARQVSGAR
jgi:polyisoprenoid-binding protein YceI